MVRKKMVLGMVAGLFGLIFVVASAVAAPIEIKFAHVNPADVFASGKSAAGAVLKNLIEADSSGGVEVKVFPASQLGGERELIEGTKIGTIQMSMVSAAIAGFYREAQVLDIPYLFSTAPIAWKVMDGWFGKEMAEDCLKKTGMRVLAWGETGFRNFTNSTRPIKSPADMKGLKLRVMESPVYVNMVKALGAAPTPITWAETYTALQQKVVDGQENPVAVIVFAKLYEVQKYMILDGHSYGIDFLLINDKFYQSLPADLQRIIVDAAQKAGAWNRDYAEKLEVELVGKLKEKGMQVNEVDQEPFRKLMVSVWDDFTNKTPEAKKYLDQILKTE
jgi:tripartite ATP-independent transporter DctP family solute receptor